MSRFLVCSRETLTEFSFQQTNETIKNFQLILKRSLRTYRLKRNEKTQENTCPVNRNLNKIYMKKSKIYILLAFVILMFSSCAAYSIAHMTSSNMNKLELGMSKEQVTQILGSAYTIAEKRMEDDKRIEVLSYRDYYNNDEFYMFIFKNDKLERWYRELLPKEKTKEN